MVMEMLDMLKERKILIRNNYILWIKELFERNRKISSIGINIKLRKQKNVFYNILNILVRRGLDL